MFSSLMWFADEAKPEKMMCARCCGALIEYSVVSGRAVLSRVISTDPSSFLDGRLYPGADITDMVDAEFR